MPRTPATGVVEYRNRSQHGIFRCIQKALECLPAPLHCSARTAPSTMQSSQFVRSSVCSPSDSGRMGPIHRALDHAAVPIGGRARQQRDALHDLRHSAQRRGRPAARLRWTPAKTTRQAAQGCALQPAVSPVMCRPRLGAGWPLALFGLCECTPDTSAIRVTAPDVRRRASLDAARDCVRSREQ